MLPSAFELRARIALAITETMNAHGIAESVTWEDIAVTDAIVTDALLPKQTIAHAIVNKLWPSIRSAEVYHYTSRASAESILDTNTFRLTNIGKRIGEGEIQTFCETHQLSGYLADRDGHPAFRELIEPNTFYASFTDANINEAEERDFWRAFGEVRLRIAIEAHNRDFRRVFYESRTGVPIPVLDALRTRLKTEFNREWILPGLSRICSFYLSGARYGWEKELRILWRVWDGSPCPAVGVGPDSFVEVPLGQMSACGFQLSVVEVCAEEPVQVPTGVPFVIRTR